MKMILKGGILLLLLAMISCAKEVLHPTEVYRTKDLKIEFLDFTDSRCPLNANCIWEGEAEVFLRATSGKNVSNFSLKNTGSDTVLYGYQITFEALLPYPESGKEIAPADKEVKLKVEKQ